MNTKNIHNTIIAIAILAAILSACAAPTPQTIEITKEITVQVPATVIVKETITVLQTVIVTATPIPATNTPVPTATPTPIPFQKWTAAQVVDVFKAAGLEIGEPTKMTKDDIGLAPYVTDDMIHIYLPSLCADCGGRIFSLQTQKDADVIRAYYDELGKISAIYFSWTIAKDNIIVQLNGDLSEEKYNAYKAALENLGK